MRGWSFGFYIAPWPREEHLEGDLVRSLFMLDGYVCLSPWRFRAWTWMADPADRPVLIEGDV